MSKIKTGNQLYVEKQRQKDKFSLIWSWYTIGGET